MKRGRKEVHSIQISTEVYDWLVSLKLTKRLNRYKHEEDTFDSVLKRIKNKDHLII